MKRRYGMVVNVSRCIGCHTCVLACKHENSLPLGSRFITVSRIGPHGIFPDVKQHYVSILCMQCEKAPCMEACPIEGALYRQENGIVLVDEQKCNGCEACLRACPYGAIILDPAKKVALKFDFCINRLKEGRLLH